MQKSDLCVLCRSKIDNLDLSHFYNAQGLAHISCIEDKTCLFCGSSGLCIRCNHKDCAKTFHYHCSARFVENALFCELHQKGKSKKKECQKLWLSYSMANRANLSTEAVKKLKETDNKVNPVCTGQIFWFSINSQYYKRVSLPSIPVTFSASQWPEDLPSEISNIESELQSLSSKISDLVSGLPDEPNPDYKEDDLILSETKNLDLKEGLESYLKFFESKSKRETSSSMKTSKKNSLREVPKNEEDFTCSICNDGDYEDDDLIVICSLCEMAAHMKCYGILVVPEGDWVCHGCRFKNREERNSIKCALCTVKGGCVKPTINVTSPELSFPNYPKGSAEVVWCHVFCAVNLEAGFGDRDQLEQIDLRKVDKERFELKCMVCKTRDGACLQCMYGRCQLAFHPECGKEMFNILRNKLGNEEISYFCPSHKPFQLRRTLELREKKTVEDVYCFSKQFDRIEKRLKFGSVFPVKKNTDRPFTYEEKGKLIKALENHVAKLCEKQFFIYLKLGDLNDSIEITRPELYNLLDPEAITHYNITIEGRKPSECQKFYSESIYPIMKKELEILKKNVVKHNPNSKLSQLNLSQNSKLSQLSLTQKPGKNKKKVLVQQRLDSMMVGDIVTKELYCICRKPFIEQAIKRIWETEQEFLKRTEDTKMIQCEKCDEWYHYKCIKIDPNNLPEAFYCNQCIN